MWDRTGFGYVGFDRWASCARATDLVRLKIKASNCMLASVNNPKNICAAPRSNDSLQ